VEPLFLSLDEVLEIYRQQIERYGGAPGVRDLQLLESAIAHRRPPFRPASCTRSSRPWRQPICSRPRKIQSVN